jgi:hypothetical protein
MTNRAIVIAVLPSCRAQKKAPVGDTDQGSGLENLEGDARLPAFGKAKSFHSHLLRAQPRSVHDGTTKKPVNGCLQEIV